jgi:hypothetical protein
MTDSQPTSLFWCQATIRASTWDWIDSKSKLFYDWRSVSMSWCWAHLLPVGRLLSESHGPVSVGHLLWREDGSAVCSAIMCWLELHRTHYHILLSHLRLPQPGGPGLRIYIPQEQGGPVQSQKSKSRYDGWPVIQYVLVSSPRGFRGAVFE